MGKRPVLVLGAEPRITVPIARSLQRLGVPVFAASISDADPTLCSRAIAGFFRLPSPAERPDDFLNALSAKIKVTGTDMLIPAPDGPLSAVSQHYDKLKSLVHLACPSPAVVDRVLNKETTSKIAASLGIRVPPEYVVSSSTSANVIRQFAFPVIAKPKEKRAAAELFKVRYFHTAEELSETLKGRLLDDAILQGYCLGDGVGVEMLIHEQNCIAAFQHRRLSEFPRTGGVAVTAVAEVLDPELAGISLKLLRGLEWEGVAMVEFRHDRRTGLATMIEVNGRYWGSLSLAIQAGIDFPAYQWKLAHGEIPRVPSCYAAGMTWRWSAGCLKRWHGRLISANRAVPAASSPSQNAAASAEKRDALWKAEDPFPALFELLNTSKALLLSDAQVVVNRILSKRRLSSPRPGTSSDLQMVQTRSGIKKGDAADPEVHI